MQYRNIYDVPLYKYYDYSSIAHFANNYRANSDKPTFDLIQLSDTYCENKFKPTVKCKKGFPKSDGSNKCVCPTSYTVKTCKDLQYTGDPKSIFHFKRARELPKKQEILFNDITKCTVEITAPEEKRIRIHVETINCTSNDPCFEDDCLQIKYCPSMTNTDLCLCGTLKNLSLSTLGNKALIQYKGKHRNHHAYISFWSD